MQIYWKKCLCPSTPVPLPTVEVDWQGCSACSSSIAMGTLPCTIDCLGVLKPGKWCGWWCVWRMRSEIKLYCDELLPPMIAVYPPQQSFYCLSHRGCLNLWGILTFFCFSQPQESSPLAGYPPEYIACQAKFLAHAVLYVLLFHWICLMAFHWGTGTDTYFLPAAFCSVCSLWQVVVPTQQQLGSWNISLFFAW